MDFLAFWTGLLVHISVSISVSTWDLRDTPPCSRHAVPIGDQRQNNGFLFHVSRVRLLLVWLTCSSSCCLEVTELAHLASRSVYWQLDLKAVCLEYTARIYVLVPTNLLPVIAVLLQHSRPIREVVCQKYRLIFFFCLFVQFVFFNSVERLRVGYGHGVQNFIQ